MRLDYDMKQVGLALPPQAKDILKRQARKLREGRT